MLHSATELRFINAEIGVGVFATAFIPKGTITWVRCKLDRVFSAEEAAAMGPPYDAVLARYAYTDGMGRLVLCWDFGRFMNHSCDPTCISPGFDCDIAVRDIAPGEELTCDYSMLNLDEALTCMCGSASCRGRIAPADGTALAERWDAAVESAFQRGSYVEQPLLALMTEREQVMRAFRGESAVPSTRRHLRYGKERAIGVRVEPSGTSFRVVATEPLEPGRLVLRCEGPAVDDGALSPEERALALFVKTRGLVVPRNELRFVGRAAVPNAALDEEGGLQITRPVAPGEALTLSDATA